MPVRPSRTSPSRLVYRSRAGCASRRRPASPGNFELALVPAPQPDDQVVDASGATNVFVEALAAPALETLTLDTDPGAEGPGFVLTPSA